MQQVFRLERRRIDKRTAARTVRVVFGIPNLKPAQADAKRLVTINRGHWGIENRLHWVRDVVFGADTSRIHTGKAPQVMAVFRNLAISFLGLLGYDSPIKGLRHFACHSDEAAKLVTECPGMTAWTRMK